MPHVPVDLSTISRLYDFIEAAGRPTGLVLDSEAPHRPWARSVAAGCAEVAWYYPAAPLPSACVTHLQQLAHHPMPEKGFLLLERGQIRRTVDVAAVEGSQQPHRLVQLVRETFHPKPSDPPRQGAKDHREPPRPDPLRPTADPYESLGATPQDSIQVLKSKYKRALLQYHPDRVAHLGPELKELAARKTTEINAAFAAIRKLRGF
jgi:hypothetical protein